jgi:hypothetical protein
MTTGRICRCMRGHLDAFIVIDRRKNTEKNYKP